MDNLYHSERGKIILIYGDLCGCYCGRECGGGMNKGKSLIKILLNALITMERLVQSYIMDLIN